MVIDEPLDECKPDTKIVERVIEIDSQLLKTWPLPDTPVHSDNDGFYNWCLVAAESSIQANKQLVKIDQKQKEIRKEVAARNASQ